MIRWIGVTALLLCPRLFFAQPADSAGVLEAADFLEMVLNNHPAARRAGLLDARSAAYTRMMRGNFDPKLYSDLQQKFFKGDEYFTISESGIKAPLWYGISLKGAYATASGGVLNPENKLPAGGQAVLGAGISLIRGLVFDERRAGVQQARINTRMNEAEKRLLRNDLAMEAITAYWEWSAAYAQLGMLEQAVEAARRRQNGIVQSFLLGDKPAIDTLESFLVLQSREMELNDAALIYQNTAIAVSGYLWDARGNPLKITDMLRPSLPEKQPEDVVKPDTVLARLGDAHPFLELTRQKIRLLETEQRLNREQLKPRLDVEYNLLGDRWQFGDASAGWFGNYKWGVKLEYPLFTRKERGKLELTAVKLLDTQYELQQKYIDVANKFRRYYAAYEITVRQLELARSMASDYEILLAAEQQKFNIGESSIFLINSREQKLIDARVKSIKLNAECMKLLAALQWSAGELAE